MAPTNTKLIVVPGDSAPLAEGGLADRSTVPALDAGPSGPPGADDRIVPASPARPRTAASPLVLILAGGLVALPLGSRPLLGWIEALPNPGALQPAAQAWHDAMGQLGLTTMDSALRRFVRSFEAERFDGPADQRR